MCRTWNGTASSRDGFLQGDLVRILFPQHRDRSYRGSARRKTGLGGLFAFAQVDASAIEGCFPYIRFLRSTIDLTGSG